MVVKVFLVVHVDVTIVIIILIVFKKVTKRQINIEDEIYSEKVIYVIEENEIEIYNVINFNDRIAIDSEKNVQN